MRHPYVPPSDLNPESAATIVGSKLQVTAPLAEDIRMLVSAVDGKLTRTSHYDWENPVVVTSGPHLVQLVAIQGMGKAEIATRVNLEAGKRYTVRLSKADPARSVTIWLEDSQTGAAASNKVEVVYGFAGIP